jgi:hypothetical protein
MSVDNGDMPAMPVECYFADSTIDKNKVHGLQTSNHSWWEIGLTKRELFAAMAMQGMAAIDAEWIPEYVAGTALRMADALLSELAKKACAS